MAERSVTEARSIEKQYIGGVRLSDLASSDLPSAISSICSRLFVAEAFCESDFADGGSHLAWTLDAIRSDLEIVEEALDRFFRDYGSSIGGKIQAAVSSLQRLEAEGVKRVPGGAMTADEQLEEARALFQAEFDRLRAIVDEAAAEA